MKSLCWLVALVIVAGPAKAIDVSATLAWAQRVELGSLVSGVVTEVHVQLGETVKKGDRLVTLDARGFRSSVARHQAALTHAELHFAEAQREAARAQELYDRTVLSDVELHSAQLAMAAARADLERARAALTVARLELERSVLRAPFDGVVVSLAAVPGQSLVSELRSETLVTLADHSLYKATALLDADLAARLRSGDPLRATLRGRAIAATVTYIGLEPERTTDGSLRYALVVDLVADPAHHWRVGERIQLHLD